MYIQFQLAQQCIQISTRINSSSVHTYIFVCFTLRVILQGFVTQNATRCIERDVILVHGINDVTHLLELTESFIRYMISMSEESDKNTTKPNFKRD